MPAMPLLHIMSGNWVAAALVHSQSEHSHPPAGGLPPYASVVPFEKQ